MGNELLDESLCDIIAEKRRSAEHIRNNLSTVPVRQWEQQAEIKSLEDEADRLEAANRREIDLLKQRCTELNAEVAAKDEVIKRLNDAISEEQRRKMATASKSSAVGDAAKLRGALTKVKEWMEHRIATCGFEPSATFPTMLEDVVLPALATPPRNCDVVPVEAPEAADMFHRERPLHGYDYETHEWLLAPATEKEGGNDGR